MGVTTQHNTEHHAAHDYTDAARKSLAADLDIIARKCEHDARGHAAHAAHLLEEHQAARDTGLFKASKADQARALAEALRHEPEPLTDEQRGDVLLTLAQQANEHAVTDEQVLTQLAALASAVDDPVRREYLFDDLREAVHDRDGLATGDIDWRTTGCTGIGGQQRALDVAHGRVDAALWPLLHPGETRCVDCVGRSAHPRAATVGDRCEYHAQRHALGHNGTGSAA